MASKEAEQTPQNDSKKEDQQFQLLQALDQTFDYEGRVQSQTTTSATDTAASFRSGYVSVIGAPNMGKSTLANALLQEPLCIATRRPQTTRHAILGILTTDDCQVLLLDTPGIIGTPAYKLQEGMMEAVQGALKDADVLLIVTDLFSTPIPNDALFAKVQQQQAYRPIVVVINKIDLMTKVNPNNKVENDKDKEKTVTVEQAVARWRQLLPEAVCILPTCASEGPDNPGVQALRTLLTGGPDLPAALRGLGRPVPGMFRPGETTLQDEQAQALLPRGPPLYDPDMYTDRTERFLASELIRAALLETFQKELPYCAEVQVTSFKEQQAPNKPLLKLEADIYVERDSQKKIVIGKQGAQIKQVGIVARQSLEEFFQTKIYLQLQVKVDKDWRKKDDKLKKFGYLK